MKECGVIFPRQMPVVNRRPVIFVRTINKCGKCHLPTKLLWAATVQKLIRSHFLTCKRKAFKVGLAGRKTIHSVVSEVTANCWLLNYKRIRLSQVFHATFLFHSTLFIKTTRKKSLIKSLIFLCSSFSYMLSPPSRFLLQRAQSLLQLFRPFLTRWCTTSKTA